VHPLHHALRSLAIGRRELWLRRRRNLFLVSLTVHWMSQQLAIRSEKLGQKKSSLFLLVEPFAGSDICYFAFATFLEQL